MADLDDARDGGDEALPSLALLGQHAAAFPGDPVVAAAALSGLLDPPAADPAALFEAVEQGIERGHGEPHLAARARLDQLRHLVAVPGPVLDEREDDELGAAFLELAIEDPGI